MTIFQIKSILKQVLLLSGLVYLLFGRSIPGVSESTSVQFNSLCIYRCPSQSEKSV